MTVPAVVLAVEAERIAVSGLDAPLQRLLCHGLSVPNPKFVDAEKFGRWTGGIEPTLQYGHRTPGGEVLVPRGAMPDVVRLCAEHELSLTVRDKTVTAAHVDFTLKATLYPQQHAAVGQATRSTKGMIVAPPGAGKTVMALALVAMRRQPALWIVHTNALAEQTRERAMQFLDLDPSEIGMVGGGKTTIGKRLTIGMLQTLSRRIPDELLEGIGHVIVDECHHVPAPTAAAVISQFPARYLLGLSATPYRRDGLDGVIRLHLGPVLASLAGADMGDRLVAPEIVKRDTGIKVRGDNFTNLVTQLVQNRQRTSLITNDIAYAVGRGRSPLVLTDRVDHAECLAAELKSKGLRAGLLHGGMKKLERDDVMQRLEAGRLQILVATSQLLGEGFDRPCFDILFLTTPISWRGRVTQYVGRVCRTAPGKDDALVLDYCDDHFMLWGAWRARWAAYDEAGYAIHRPQQRVAS
jgi:superfamily II DNA or RNA helicase